MALPAAKVYGVQQLTEIVRRKVEGDGELRRVAVRGEITNYKVSSAGHAGFALKEGDALLHAIAWQSVSRTLPRLANGMQVVATGSIQVWKAGGRHQLYVTAVELAGVGDVHAQFEERKKRLAAEGLFATERKRPLPAHPFAVALVSSRAAAGASDFLKLLRKRAPHVRVVFCDTPVQGADAGPAIATAIDGASRLDVDAVVVTRGGGSFEDLFVFSDEKVVRAIARCRLPVVSAIGHTIDRQLSDLVADRYCETPSDAAEALGRATRDLEGGLNAALVAARSAVERNVDRLRKRIDATLVRSLLAEPAAYFAGKMQNVADRQDACERATRESVRRRHDRLAGLERRLAACDPGAKLAARGLRLERLRSRLHAGVSIRLAGGERNLAVLRARLDGKDPDAILEMGYARVEYERRIVRDPGEVPPGGRIAAHLARGTLYARVEAQASNGDEGIG